jgi:hypothetical protein
MIDSSLKGVRVRALVANVCCVSIAVVAAVGCHHVGPPPGEDDDWDDDGSGDTDGDSDADSDTDADSDSDADSETSTDDGCPLGSGWPCTCVLDYSDDQWSKCDDGSICAVLAGLEGPDYGVCMAPCDELGGDCPPHGFSSDAQCAVEHPPESQYYCVLACSSATSCPPGQTCKELYDVWVCHT